MIGYTLLGSNHLERARAFYGAFLGAMGATALLESPRLSLYGRTPEQPMLGVCTPYDEQAAQPGNGNMVALAAGSRERVDQLHELALTLGGSDEGRPGERFPGFYMAYFRDPDGNKLALFHKD